LYPEDGKRRSDLLKNADIALGAAKKEGGAKLVFYDRSMRTNRQDSAAMLSMARDAVINDWIIPYYQPKISLVTGRIEGFEALLRWHHPYDGIQDPGPIAAAFDDLELAASIGDRMTALVLADMWRWTREGIDFGHVSINASAAEFRHGDYGETLVARLKKAAIEPKRMQVEVAESVFLNRGADYISNALAHLSASGIAVSLDNFGTGNASLAQLRQIPVHSIKIDPSFVSGLVDDASDQTVVRALLSFCHDIGIHTTAKGVETRAQEEYLRHFGCDTGQGFLFAKAACASHVPDLLKNFGSRSPAAPGLIERREGPIRPWRGRRQAGRRAAV
jgi:EAL domain-containing protein (putative c-di-GMP-specific phosphodiesterase class I)